MITINQTVNLKVFKLNYSGNFDEVKSENLLDLFSIVNVLSIYVPMQKRMYIWIGKTATQGLKKHIAQTRALFSTQFPELKILRNITIESGSEPSDFFQFIGFSYEDLEEHLKKQEEALAPVIKKINTLISKQNKLIESEKYADAIKISEQIIELSHEINDTALESEHKDIISELKEKADLKTDIDKIKDETLDIKNKFENLIETKISTNIIEAHKIVEKFKQKYKQSFDLSTIPKSSELIKKDETIWSNFIKDQQFSTKTLEKLEKQIRKALKEHKILEAEESLKRAKEHLLHIIDVGIKDEWNKIETELLEKKIKSETLEKIEESIAESTKLKKKYEFEEAIRRLNSTIELIQDKDILEYSKRLQELKEDLLEAEKNFKKINEEILALEEKVKENRKNKQFYAALLNSEKIIEKSESIKKHDTVLKYTSIIEELKEQINKIETEQKLEKEKLLKKAKEIEKAIKFDQNVLPIVEEFSVDEIIGDLSDDIDQMMDEIGKLLDEHRVEVKEEISTKTLIKTASGEAVELTQNTEVQKTQEDDQKVKFRVKSGLVNPFDDVIEEAIITDLIPYNYEITEVHLNGEPVKELPDKTLTKQGIELEWKIQNIPPKEEVDINYDLRRRVSRTIIFILKGRLSIIKTHASLKILKLEGLYEASLPFTNSFGEIINGVIVEDIIPLYYLHFIKEPLKLLPAETSSSKLGDLIKWNIGTMEPKTINYQYRLLELYRLEEIKINIDILSKSGIESLNKGDLTEALEVYEKIINQLEEYNK
ncbi:MAG: hypothetical protein ACFFHV_00025 [Promethearchaeota archaeon]